MPQTLTTTFENNSLSNGAYSILGSYENWTGTRGIEVWKNHRGYSAAEGNSWIELDVSGANTLNGSYETQTGTNYTLSFSSSPRPGVPAASNSFEVYWNNQLVDTIAVNGTGLTALNWRTYTYQVTATGNDNLSFREYDANGLGALLDNITLTPENSNPSPTPPPLTTTFENNSLSNGAYSILVNYENWTGTRGIEVWKNHRGYSAAEGNSWIELDVSGTNTLNGSYTTQAGTDYALSFSSAPRPGVPAASNSFEVYWNGQLLDTIAVNGTGLTSLNWQRYSYRATATGNDTLSFREYDTDGLGALLDNIVISAQSNNFPAQAARATNKATVAGGIGTGGLSFIFPLLALLAIRSRYKLGS